MVTVMERRCVPGRGVRTPVTRVMVVEEGRTSKDIFVLTQSLEPYIEIVYVAESQMEALEAFAQVSPELVLVDYPLWERAPVASAKLMKQKFPEAQIAFISSQPASRKCSASSSRPSLARRRPASSNALRRIPFAQASLYRPLSSFMLKQALESASSSSNVSRCSGGT